MAKSHYTDPNGESIPAKYVKRYDKLRDNIATQILKEWQAMETKLAAVKDNTLLRIEKLQEAAAKEAGVKPLGGKKGNVMFRSFDGNITVALDRQSCTEFDERLQIAQALIMEVVHELAAETNSSDLVEIATKAFQPRKSGNLDMQRIRDLRTYNVKHPKWKQACQIISECERSIGHRTYVRVSVRPTPNSLPVNIVLDIARVKGSK